MSAFARPEQAEIPTSTDKAAPVLVDSANLKARRDKAMTATFGILKDKHILPGDGLQFEREMREWPSRLFREPSEKRED